MPFSDWLHYSLSIKQLDYELEISIEIEREFDCCSINLQVVQNFIYILYTETLKWA